MALHVTCLFMPVLLAACFVAPCLAQEDCADADVELVTFEGGECDNDDSGPRVCGDEAGQCGSIWRGGPCPATGRTLFCNAGRCVAENEARVGYACDPAAPACGENARCMREREGDVERCMVVVAAGSEEGCAGVRKRFHTCEQGSECVRECVRSTCSPGVCVAAE